MSSVGRIQLESDISPQLKRKKAGLHPMIFFLTIHILKPTSGANIITLTSSNKTSNFFPSVDVLKKITISGPNASNMFSEHKLFLAT